MVTKLNFSRLFSQAWIKAIKPENIVNGFKKCGVCPLNRNMIEIPSTPNSSSQSPVSDASSPVGTGNSSIDKTPPNSLDPMDVTLPTSDPIDVTPPTCFDSMDVTLPTNAYDEDPSAYLYNDESPLSNFIDHTLLPVGNAQSFSADQVARFEKRFENGFDVYVDADYVAWMRLNHPDSLPHHLAASSSPPGFAPSSSPEKNSDKNDTVNLSTPVSKSLTSAQRVLSDVTEFLNIPKCSKVHKPLQVQGY